MARSYRHITPELARQIRLLMADVDGTLTPGGDSIGSSVLEAICRLEEQRIMVGLISGRTIQRLESLAKNLGISGPVIAENGAVAKIKVGGELLDLGYSRQPALKALKKLKDLFPDRIVEREDNRDRLVDVVFWSQGVQSGELRSHLEEVQLLNSVYILHLMQEGISKGKTLLGLLGRIGAERLSPAEVLVIGDSTTDQSLFELFPYSVLIPNPRLSLEEREQLQNAALFVSDHQYGEGFAEVARHILDLLTSG